MGQLKDHESNHRSKAPYELAHNNPQLKRDSHNGMIFHL